MPHRRANIFFARMPQPIFAPFGEPLLWHKVLPFVIHEKACLAKKSPKFDPYVKYDRRTLPFLLAVDSRLTDAFAI